MDAACAASSLSMNEFKAGTIPKVPDAENAELDSKAPRPPPRSCSFESLPVTDFQDDSSIGRVLLHFCKETLYTDVIFNVRCDDKWVEFPVHKLVVCVWSPVFSDMLAKKEEKVVNVCAYQITDALPTVFDAMIKFMYGSRDAVYNMRKDTSFILKLMKAASAYRVEELRRLCWEIINNSSPTVDNLFHLLEAADFYGYPVLEKRCLKVLQSRTHLVLQGRDLGSFTPTMIRTVLSQPRVSFESEFDLATWMFAWVKNRFLSNDNLTDIRSIAMDVLPYLRLDALSAVEFGKLVEDHSDIMDEKEGFAIFMNIVIPGSRPMPDWYQKGVERVYRYNGSN